MNGTPIESGIVKCEGDDILALSDAGTGGGKEVDGAKAKSL